jgi:hypothetical protein
VEASGLDVIQGTGPALFWRDSGNFDTWCPGLKSNQAPSEHHRVCHLAQYACNRFMYSNILWFAGYVSVLQSVVEAAWSCRSLVPPTNLQHGTRTEKIFTALGTSDLHFVVLRSNFL